MAELVRGPNGEYGVWSPGTGVRQVSEDEYAVLKEAKTARGRGFVENTAREVVAQVQDVAGFGLDAAIRPFQGPRPIEEIAAGGPGNNLGGRMQTSNDVAQAGRWREAPGAAMTGFGVTLAVPGAPAGAKAGALAGRGTQRGIEIGQEVIGRARNSNTGRALGNTINRTVDSVPIVGPAARDLVEAGGRALETRSINRSLNAAENAGRRYRPDLMTPDELADFAGGGEVALHPAQRLKLAAPDEATHAEARSILKDIDYRERSAPGQLTDANANLTEQANRVFMREIGARDDILPSKEAIGDRLTEISGELNQINQRAGAIPADDLPKLVDDMIEERTLVGEQETLVRRFRDMIEGKLDEDGMLPPEQHAVINNRISDKIRSVVSTKPDVEVVEVLQNLQDRIRDKIAATLSPEDIARDRELRRQWGLSMSAVKRDAALGEGGINIKSFLGSLGTKNRGVKTGRSDDKLVKYLRTIQSIVGDRGGDSGTGQTIARMPK